MRNPSPKWKVESRKWVRAAALPVLHFPLFTFHFLLNDPDIIAGEKILELLEDLTIKEKIIEFTGDNITNNQTCQRYLQEYMNSNFIYIQYATYILNLVV